MKSKNTRILYLLLALTIASNGVVYRISDTVSRKTGPANAKKASSVVEASRVGVAVVLHCYRGRAFVDVWKILNGS